MYFVITVVSSAKINLGNLIIPGNCMCQKLVRKFSNINI